MEAPPLANYRRLLGIEWLFGRGRGGRGVKVAVIDTGVPIVDGIVVEDVRLFTKDRKTSDHAALVGSILFGRDKVKGICPSAAAFFAKVFEGGTATPQAVANAIMYAVNVWQADIVNLSLGFSGDTPCPECLRKACRVAARRGVLVLAASGDGHHAMWPAGLQDVVSVGSTRYSEDTADIYYPGDDLPAVCCDGRVETVSGSSFATAVATGIAALRIAHSRRTCGAQSPSSVVDYLKARKIIVKTPSQLRRNRFFGKIRSFIRRIFKVLTWRKEK